MSTINGFESPSWHQHCTSKVNMFNISNIVPLQIVVKNLDWVTNITCGFLRKLNKWSHTCLVSPFLTNCALCCHKIRVSCLISWCLVVIFLKLNWTSMNVIIYRLTQQKKLKINQKHLRTPPYSISLCGCDTKYKYFNAN